MGAFKALSKGTKLVLVCGPLLLLSLFFDWQTLRVDYGRAGIAELPQDGWDAWGLLLSLLVLATVTLVVLRRMTEVELSDDVPWDTVLLALGGTTFVVAAIKNATDADSTWVSYAFVALAALVAVGTYLEWDEARNERSSVVGRRRERGVSSPA